MMMGLLLLLDALWEGEGYCSGAAGFDACGRPGRAEIGTGANQRVDDLIWGLELV
jgi:hypothetical protein